MVDNFFIRLFLFKNPLCIRALTVLAAGMYKLENTPTPTRGNISRCHLGEKILKSGKEKEENVKEKGGKTKEKWKLKLIKKRMKIMQKGPNYSQKGCIKSKFWRIPGRGAG